MRLPDEVWVEDSTVSKGYERKWIKVYEPKYPDGILRPTEIIRKKSDNDEELGIKGN